MASGTQINPLLRKILREINCFERKIKLLLLRTRKDLTKRSKFVFTTLFTTHRYSHQPMGRIGGNASLEAGLLAGAEAVEHFETARCGTLVAWAKILGHDNIEKLFREPLGDDNAADWLLTGVAMRAINRRAFEAQRSAARLRKEEKGFGDRYSTM